MDTNKHTPTPWHFHELPHRPDGCGYIRTGADSLEISHHGDMGRSREENLANAALIVRACNAHDDLVSALMDVEAALYVDMNTGDWALTQGWSPTTLHAAIEKARAHSR